MNLIVSQIRYSTGSYIFPRRRVMGMIKGSDKGEGNLTREGKCGSVVVLVFWVGVVGVTLDQEYRGGFKCHCKVIRVFILRITKFRWKYLRYSLSGNHLL